MKRDDGKWHCLDDDKQPTPEQLDQMRALVRDAMKDGAVGVSTSLEYAPAPYAKTDELIALATEAGKSGGIYATHMRDESNSVLEAIAEAMQKRRANITIPPRGVEHTKQIMGMFGN